MRPAAGHTAKDVPAMTMRSAVARYNGVHEAMERTPMDRKAIANAFDEYVADYDLSDEKIRLKAEHTYHVARLCDEIARSLELPAAECDLAWACGMLHDIGRFEQVRRFGTFYDSQSVNHAEFGADLLFVDRLIDRFLAGPDPVIEIAIRNHNRLRVDEGLDERTRLFCDILRDADKIDIIRVNVESPLPEIFNAPIAVIRASAITPEVEASFYEHHCVDRALMRTYIDRMVGHFSFAYELVFPYSRAEVVRQGFLGRAMSFASDNPDTVEKLARMREEMRAFLA